MPISSKSSLSTGVLLLLLLLLNSLSHVAAQTDSGEDLVRIMRQPGASELSASCAPRKPPFLRHSCKCPAPSEDLLSILREKAAQKFCRAFIDINPKVTRTVTTTVTRCGNANPQCTATTIPVTVVETQEVKNTVTADTPTVTIPTIATVIAPTEYVVITVTSTVGTPLETVAPVRKRGQRRGPSVPGYLNSHNRYRISSACSSLIKDQITTTTKYQTRTRTVSGIAPTTTLTVTAQVTNTLVITVTPEPITIINTISTTTIVNTETTTTTTTICPDSTQQASLLGVTIPGKLIVASRDVNNVVKCCSECYYRPSGGCSAWVFFSNSSGSSGSCATVVFSNEAPDQVGQCPLGKGNYELGTSSGASAGDMGGRGPCAGTNVHRPI